MKRVLVLLTALLLLFSAQARADFAESSERFDPELARYALQIAGMSYTPSMQASVLQIGGFRQVGSFNAQRAEDDTRHVAAYTIYDRQAGGGRTEVIIVIRGTGAGEWKLNMDLMPSGNFDLPYAENFALAAEDILTANEAYFSGLSAPVFLVTGYSRGAAAANVLGARLTDRYSAENVFAYTFATPRTVRGEYPTYSNIFNIVNPADLITYLPFPGWGFERYGTDIVLPVDDPSLLAAAQSAYSERADRTGSLPDPTGAVEAVKKTVAAMEKLAPDPAAGYTIRHALTHFGEAQGEEPGMTAGEFLLTLFEGSLFSAQAGTETSPAGMQAANDFMPVLTALQQQAGQTGGSGILEMHMPATYGAWLAVMGTQADRQ